MGGVKVWFYIALYPVHWTAQMCIVFNLFWIFIYFFIFARPLTLNRVLPGQTHGERSSCDTVTILPFYETACCYLRNVL